MNIFPPLQHELDDLDIKLFAVYFVKPYPRRNADTFMKLHGYSRANIIETDDAIIYYQKHEYVPFKGEWYKFNYRLPNDVVWYQIDKVLQDKLIFKSYFSSKVIFITFRDPSYSIYVA